MLDLEALGDVFKAPRPAPPPAALAPSDLAGDPSDPATWLQARAERAAILEAEAGMDRGAADALAAALHPDPTEARPDWHGFTAGALQAAAGEDWPEVATRPEVLAALALLLRTQAQRDRGERPEHYNGIALCETCGPIWIYDRAPGPLLACPWCMATKPGAPVPRPNLELEG
ncbi:hypothetical protein [Thiocapsa roseopersicina]|uniref:Zinc-ribbon containing domain-containing protein n=1 Tax=Thiocapsa roseopersicina TaxID=1058 RepID=A0A1H3DED3_THIRO|nr:hypothetical protein [Thiocapsa roseopersicina]SDX64044.1 hypothetical protein SAMN05421783_14613 [Thiocapsa roseopersicina]